MTIGNRIRLFRNKNQLTQKKLADLVGLKTITIQSYELNKRTPNIETLNRLSQVLNVSPKTLLSDEIFEKELLNKAISLMIPILPKGADDVLAYLEEYTHDYDSLYNLHNEISDFLPIDCIKGLLNFIFQTSREDFEDIYKYLIITEIYNLDDEIKQYCKDLYSQIEFENDCKRKGFIVEGNEIKLPPIPFDEMKSKVDKVFPELQPEVYFLSNPNIEKKFNYSYNELAQKGYNELLINAIEKAIRTTLEDIETHLNDGDLFDGYRSWISKDSPLYKIIKNHDNPPNYDDEFL